MALRIQVKVGRECEVLFLPLINLDVARIAVLQVLYFLRVSPYLLIKLHKVLVVPLEVAECFVLRALERHHVVVVLAVDHLEMVSVDLVLYLLYF